MANFVKNIQSSGELFKHQYSGIDINALALNIDSLLLSQSYRLTNGPKGGGDYEKGSKVMRILFGAFAKYFKFSFRLKVLDDQSIELFVVKAASGMAGGIIGMAQVKKELKRLEQLMTTL
jgi:hypothetical protein